MEAITTEQNRIRRNMAVLNRDSEVYRRYVLKFDRQETDIERLRKELTRLKSTEQSQRQAIDRFILSLKDQ